MAYITVKMVHFEIMIFLPFPPGPPLLTTSTASLNWPLLAIEMSKDIALLLVVRGYQNVPIELSKCSQSTQYLEVALFLILQSRCRSKTLCSLDLSSFFCEASLNWIHFMLGLSQFHGWVGQDLSPPPPMQSIETVEKSERERESGSKISPKEGGERAS